MIDLLLFNPCFICLVSFLVLVFVSSEFLCVSLFVCLVGPIIGLDSGTALKRAGRSNYLRANEVRHRVIAGSAKSRLGVKKRQMQAHKKW